MTGGDNMLENLKNLLNEIITGIFETHRTRKFGFIAGLITGVAILTIGFLNTFFIFLCGVVGLFVGSRFDSKDDLVEKIIRKLDEMLPEKIQRW